MVYNEGTKIAHYKWRETHKEQYREYVNKSGKKHYETHKDELREKSLKRYHMKKVFCEFRNILIDL
jgi:hypothetical protein